MFEAEHSFCSKQNILCVRSMAFRVFEAGHSLCSKQDVPGVRSKTLVEFEAGHSLCCEQDISLVPIAKMRCHFLVDSADRQDLDES